MNLNQGLPSLSPLENALCGFWWRGDRPQEKKVDGDRLSLIRKTLGKLPARFRKKVEAVALAKHGRDGDRVAGMYLYSVADDLAGDYLSLDASDAEIIALASDMAARCRGFMADSTQGLDFCARLAHRVGVKVPDVLDVGIEGALARLSDDKWWRRMIRVHIARRVERHAIELGFVHSRAGKYSSNESLKRRTEQKARNQKTLESITVTNDSGQSYTLAELSALSVANPKIRRGELMMRIAGFEEIALDLGHVGEFYTLTCPSKYHARLSKSGGANPRYAGLSPRDGQLYLRKVFERVRAQLAKREIKLYGFRVVEPQHDATPHWHLLVFMPPEQTEYVRAVFQKQALKVDGNEPGALEHRFTAKAIDRNRGSAAGYIAKYIAKNIDGHGLEQDIDGAPIDDAARRVDAWASTWGITQFRQLGGAPVGVWRELRRVEVGEESGVVHDAARASDMSNWKKYTEIQGGPTAKRKDMPVTLLKVWSDAVNRYGVARGDITKGVMDYAVSIVTRVRTWTQSFKAVELPWSAVNNCNHQNGVKNGCNEKSGFKGGGGGGETGKFIAIAGKNWGFDRFPDLQIG